MINRQSLHSIDKTDKSKMILNDYFQAKKQNMLNFFRIFHRIIDNISQAAIQQINREVDITQQMLLTISGTQQTQMGVPDKLVNEIQKMKNRQQGIFSQVTEIICERVKQNLQHLSHHTPNSNGQMKRGLESFASNNTVEANKSNQEIKVHNLSGKRSLSKEKIMQTGKQQAYSLNNKVTGSSNDRLVTPQKKSIIVENKDNSFTDQQICESLDKKIQQEALQLLYKSKTKSSPYKRGQASPTRNHRKNSTLISINSPPLSKFTVNNPGNRSQSILGNNSMIQRSKEELMNKKLQFEDSSSVKRYPQKYQDYRRDKAHR